MLREGRNVPLAAIAAEAGVGVGTLYRRYADREALLHALEHRAYALLNQILGRDQTAATFPGSRPSASSCPAPWPSVTS